MPLEPPPLRGLEASVGLGSAGLEDELKRLKAIHSWLYTINGLLREEEARAPGIHKRDAQAQGSSRHTSA